jgi:hypothetical protein
MTVTSWWQDEIFVQSEWKLYSVIETWYSCSDRVADLFWRWFYPLVVEDYYLFTLCSRSVHHSGCSGSQNSHFHCIHWSCSCAMVILNICQYLDAYVSSQTPCILLLQRDDINNVTYMHCRLDKVNSFWSFKCPTKNKQFQFYLLKSNFMFIKL